MTLGSVEKATRRDIDTVCNQDLTITVLTDADLQHRFRQFPEYRQVSRARRGKVADSGVIRAFPEFDALNELRD